MLVYNIIRNQKTININMDSEFLTTEELATLLRIREQTVRAWAREGRIPFVKVGSDYRFIKEEVISTLRKAQESESN